MIFKWIAALTVAAMLVIACSASSSSSFCSADKAGIGCFGNSPECTVLYSCSDNGTSLVLDCKSSGCTCDTTKPDGGKGQTKKVPFESSFCSSDCNGTALPAANRACLWGIE